MPVLACGERISVEQVPQSLGVDPPPVQRGVKAAPATTMRCFEAQVDGRGDGGVRGEKSVGEFEEGVGPSVEAFVERTAEAAKSIVGFHDAFIMHSSKDRRILFPPMELKRKFRACANRWNEKSDPPRSTLWVCK